MDESRQRIHDDLRGVIRGEVLLEPLQRAPYARDASLYEIDPLGVVVPWSAEDVSAVVRYAMERSLTIHPRGAGTGLAGESLGPGLVLDFSRRMRQIVEIGDDYISAQPGAVLDDINRRLAPQGRMIGPDPGGALSCTLGGLVGGNASGARALRYGSIADHVVSIAMVLANGEAIRLGREPWPADDPAPGDTREILIRRLGSLYLHYSPAISLLPRPSPRNRCGYALDGVIRPDGLDFPRLLSGSEGTLALFTEITIKTVPIPSAQGALFLPFAKLTDAASAVPACLEEGPSACELLDWRSLTLAREEVQDIIDRVPEFTEAALIVEFLGEDADEVAGRVRTLARRIGPSPGLSGEPMLALRRSDAERLMRLRDVVRPLLMRMKGTKRAVPVIEDVALPVEELPTFLGRLQPILKQHGVNWVLHCHAGHGQVHVRPFLDMARRADRESLEPLASDVYGLVWDLGGSIAGEHGCGLVRSQFLRRQYGEVFNLFRGIKETFDPSWRLNPGKIVGEDPHQMARDLLRYPERGREDEPAPPAAPLMQLRWIDTDPVSESSRCNGCGACRTQEPSLRICPMFRALRAEEAAPRAKANLLRQVVTGRLDPSDWGSDASREIADLCVHCDLCRSECPAGVDVSGLMLEVKAAHVERHGLPLTDWMLSRIDIWSAWASRLPNLFNFFMRNRGSRWALERTFGLSRHRRLPRAHRWSFLSRADRMGLSQPRPHRQGPRVAYFVDGYANHFDQELAEAVVAVLTHAGVHVYVPRAQVGSGLAALVAGDLEHARDLAAKNLRVLGNAVRDGYTIVCSEPSAALMLRREYPRLSQDLDAALVAEATMDLGQYLAGLEERGQLPPRQSPILQQVGYHQPCHLRALGVGTPGLDLIRTIPGLEAEWIDQGCSGMAGTYGMSRRNFRNSLRAGRPLLTRLGQPGLSLGVAECGACRMQMEQGSGVRAVHPIKLLALSYGLNPELRRHLDAPRRRRGPL
ncbi:MAG: FAD-linked oxidase C-terminal domain-containing protein [Isosphaeraceae bacterium]